MNSYEFTGDRTRQDKTLNWTFNEGEQKRVVGECYLWNTHKNHDFTPSDLETPVQINFKLNLTSDNVESNYFYNNDSVSILGEWALSNSEIVVEVEEQIAEFNDEDEDCPILALNQIIDSRPSKYEIQLNAIYNNETINLCSMTLQHLAIFTEKSYSLNFTYYSETGLVFLKTGDANIGNLLTLQTFTDTGEFLVESLQSNKFMLPGDLNYPGFYNDNNLLTFSLSFSKKVLEVSDDNSSLSPRIINRNNYEQPISIECYPRTNVI